MKPIIAVSMGDPAGIGPEVTAKAVSSPGIQKICTPVIIGCRRFLKPFFKKNHYFEIVEIPCPASYTPVFGKPHRQAGEIAFQAIQQGVDVCRQGKAHALVTAPVSKYAVQLSEPSFIGHTEMLAKLCGVKDPIMMMQARHMRFVMITRHVPVKEVAGMLSKSLICRTVEKTVQELAEKYHMPVKKAVVCGLNPHAGEEGHIGEEEKNIILPAIRMLKRKGVSADGPLPADIAIRKTVNNEYDICFTMYHDQAMIPLKIVEPQKIVNITLGLPIVRTSPGHGTAFDIAGKNKAAPKPMEEAIQVAVAMAVK